LIRHGTASGALRSHESHAIFYVGVPDVEAALRKAESLGGKRKLNPSPRPDGKLFVAHFTDPEGNLIGLAGPV
jgi:predicted enzyme related to lactoylglutathione lyase